MNPLLAQFLAEAGDLLSQVDEGLLQLERDPGDQDLINDIFRAAHTLKGSSGLFDFPELTRLTHAAEDLLDAVRAGSLEMQPGTADDLLAAFHLVRSWLAHVTTHERLPVTAADDAATLVSRLRAPLGGPAVDTSAETAAVPAATNVAPPWIGHFDPEWLTEVTGWLEYTASSLRFTLYTPDEDCFFRGEDPLYLIRQIPAIERLVVIQPESWPPPDEYDEYACRISFAVAARAGVGELSYLFRYVTEQVATVELDGAALRSFLNPDPDAPVDAPRESGTEPQDDAGLAADARVMLMAAQRSLAVAEIGPNQLLALANAVEAAAHALGQPVDLDGADREAVGEAVTRMLATAPQERVAPAPAGETPHHLGDPVDPVARADDSSGKIGARILKVDQEKVDRLMELVGELNVAKNGLTFLAGAAEEEFGSRILSRRIKDQYAGLHRIAEELQSAVMDIRMLPLSVAFARFPRLVRDLGRRLGKPIKFVTAGEDTMADKDVIEALSDPLVHLIRNSIDHGIESPSERFGAGKPETASVCLNARADGDAVIVEVIDDGRGIDPARVRRKAYEKGVITEEELESLTDEEALDLIFRPGFSTADQISDLSGRGVGMDAVRASVDKLGGAVTMTSTLGVGTRVVLRLPLSMAVTQVMVVSVAGQRFGIPVDLVVETVRVPSSEMNRVLAQEVVVLRGDVVPVLDLARVLDMPWTPEPGQDQAVLVVSVNGQRVGLRVEQFHREVDVLLKPMEGLLAFADEFSGTALLGDGLVLLVLNVKEVLNLAARVA